MDRTHEEIVESRQYLTFVSAGNDYAIPIMRMREIVRYTGSTKVPLAPRVIRGLINLRGRPIPVLDLSVRFGSAKTEVTKRTCVLIVDLDEDQDRPDMGILADSVNRVIDVDSEELEETPSFGMGVSPEYLCGMVKSEDGFIPIIDVEEVLQSEVSLEAVFPGEEQPGAANSEEEEPGGSLDATSASEERPVATGSEESQSERSAADAAPGAVDDADAEDPTPSDAT